MVKTKSQVKAFKCDCCGQRFSTRGNLNQHLTIHTGEKPFQCEYCEKKFIQKSSLKMHLKIHTGEKSFQCEYCEKKFTQKGTLKSHITIHIRNLADGWSHLSMWSILNFTLKIKKKKLVHVPIWNFEIKSFWSNCSLKNIFFEVNLIIKRHCTKLSRN